MEENSLDVGKRLKISDTAIPAMELTLFGKKPDTSFDDIPDDCVTYIFLLLPILDKIRVESVCKRFRDISRDSWYLFEKLDFSPETWGWPKEKTKCIDRKIFKEVLKRCQKYLKTIDLNTTIRDEKSDENGLYHSLQSLSIHDISQMCSNLRCLYINEIQIHPSRKTVTSRRKKYKHTSGYSVACNFITYQMIQSLIEHCENLIHFSLNLQRHDYNKECMSNLIRKMTKLKMLHLSSGSKLPGGILLGLSLETIEEIFLEECNSYWTSENANLLNDVLESCKKLHTFVLNNCIQDGKVDLPRMENLKNLGLIYKMRDSNQLRCVPQLYNLRKLNVEANNNVDDLFLKEVSKNCSQLIYLNISRCCHLSDKGMTDIGKLGKLEYLIMSYTKLSSRYLCGASAKLKLLDCSNCKKVSDCGLNTLIQWTLGLKMLILQMCPKVTDSLVRAININIQLRNSEEEKSPYLILSNDGTMLDDWRISHHVKVVKKIVRKFTYGTDLKDVYFHSEKDYAFISYVSVFDECLI